MPEGSRRCAACGAALKAVHHFFGFLLSRMDYSRPRNTPSEQAERRLLQRAEHLLATLDERIAAASQASAGGGLADPGMREERARLWQVVVRARQALA